MYIHVCIYIYIYIYMYIYARQAECKYSHWSQFQRICVVKDHTPGLHNKIPAHKIFARVWVAQEPFFSLVAAKTSQGLGPKRRKSCDGDRVYKHILYILPYLIMSYNVYDHTNIYYIFSLI